MKDKNMIKMEVIMCGCESRSRMVYCLDSGLELLSV